jgi:hypothetical protein
LLGARIVDLLKEVSKIPLVPIHTNSNTKPSSLVEATGLEVEHGIASSEYILEVVCGIFNNRISLEGRTNKTTMLWLSSGGEYTE